MGSSDRHISTRRVAALVSLLVGIALLGVKWAAYWLTGSYAIFSDALESIVNVVASGFALMSILLNERPPDPKYPYGYGKITYFSAGFEGALIALAACAIVYQSIQALVYGSNLRKLDVGLILVVVASLVNLGLGVGLIRQGKRTRSLVLEADGRHVLTDVYTSIGVVLGLALVLITGWQWLDGAVAILLALNILWTGYGLVRAGVIGLMDRADPEVLARIVAALQVARQPGWIDLHQLRAWQSGDRIYVDFHLVVPDDWTVAQVHDTHLVCREILRRTLGEETEVIIHFDPQRARIDLRETPRPWTLSDAVHVPAAGELGSEFGVSDQAHAMIP
jgi:cation diffusion facilitator family transporter